MEEKITYWKELSEYDLETADAMLETKGYLCVDFMCHQAVEKIFKTYFVKQKSSDPPYSYRLAYIAEKEGFYQDFLEEQQFFIDQLDPMNIETRYPADQEQLMKSLTAAKCKGLLFETKKLYQWTKQRL